MKEYIILLLVIGGFYLLFAILDLLHISFSLFLFVIVVTFGYCILFIPKPVIFFLNRRIDTKDHSLKRAIAILLFYIMMKWHDRFWEFVTRYYPFSLLYRDRFFHAENKPVKRFIHELEEYGKSIHLPFYIRGGDGSEAMALFWAKQTGGRKLKKEEYLRKLQEKLQEKYETIYLSPQLNGFTIHVPTSMVKAAQG